MSEHGESRIAGQSSALTGIDLDAYFDQRRRGRVTDVVGHVEEEIEEEVEEIEEEVEAPAKKAPAKRAPRARKKTAE
jgi:hypothetical protein